MKINYINEPSENSRVYKFINGGYVDSFLNGELYFSSLKGYEEFYEGIDHDLYILTFLERTLVNKALSGRLESKRIIGLSESLNDGIDSLMILNYIKEHTNYQTDEEIKIEFGRILGSKSNLLAKHKIYQKNTYSNCWFVTDFMGFEPVQMWEQYAQGSGVMYETSYANLKLHLNNSIMPKIVDALGSDIRVYAGMIKYRDFADPTTWDNSLPKGFYKESSFKDEREFRILIETNEYSTRVSLLLKLIPFLSIIGNIVLHPKTKMETVLEKVSSRTNKRASFRVSKLYHVNQGD